MSESLFIFRQPGSTCRSEPILHGLGLRGCRHPTHLRYRMCSFCRGVYKYEQLWLIEMDVGERENYNSSNKTILKCIYEINSDDEKNQKNPQNLVIRKDTGQTHQE